MTPKRLLDERKSSCLSRQRVKNELPERYKAVHEARILAHQRRVEGDLRRLGLLHEDE